MIRRTFIALGALAISRLGCTATEDQVTALEGPAQAGSRQAIRELFALRQEADGAVAEDIDIALGSTIRAYPKPFLEELKRSAQTQRLGGLLANAGPKFVDDFVGQLGELRERRSALATVKVRELIDVRTKCLSVLDAEIVRMQPHASRGSGARTNRYISVA